VNTNSDMEIWRLAWRDTEAQAATTFDVRREGRRQQRRLRARHVLELGLAVILLAFAGFFLQRNFSVEILVWALVVWATTLAATAFSVWNWRELWRETSQSTSEYAAAYRTRCLAGLRAVRFGFALLAVQWLIVVPWFTWDFLRQTMSGVRYAFGMGWLVLVTAALTGMLTYQRRGALLELRRLEEFQRDLSNQD
jgi:uncharacterized membrane protein YfcA